MTIAIGVLCSDGIVLGADTEYTGAIKQPGAKVWGIHAEPSDGSVSCGLAGSGDGILLRSMRDRIGNALNGATTHADVVSVVEEQVVQLYQKHVFPNPAFNDKNQAVNLVIGARDKNSFGLYETSGSALAASERYACVGYGSDLGSYLLETLLDKKPPTTLIATALVTYVIKQAKAYSLYCGGDTYILTMQHEGELSYVPLMHIALMERQFVDADTPKASISLAAAGLLLVRRAIDGAKSEQPVSPRADPPVRPSSKRGRKARPPSRA
jgi:20S proteasome alpha/beta subunit